jgi:hypothetical protein
MGDFEIATTGKPVALPGSTMHSPLLKAQLQQREAQQDNDHISRNSKSDASVKPNTIPRGNGQSSIKKKNKKSENSRFSRVVVDGLSSGKFWLGVLGSSALMLFIFFISDTIQDSNSNSSNITMKR